MSKGFGRKASRLSKCYTILYDGVIITRIRSKFFIEGIFNGAFDKRKIRKRALKRIFKIDPDVISDKIKKSLIKDSEILNGI